MSTLGKKVEITISPDSGSVKTDIMGLDLKPVGLKFSPDFSAILKIKYNDTLIQQEAELKGMTANEFEQSFIIAREVDKKDGERYFIPYTTAGKDIENNIIVIKVEQFF